MERRIAVMEAKALERQPDERLLIEAAQSEPARFADLYGLNFDRVYAFFARRVETREEAQDLTAEVFHQALASIRSFKWQGAPFVAWLYGIAAHVLAAHWQKPGKSAGIEDLDLGSASDEIERSVILGQLVEALPTEQRLVVVRRFIDGKSIREIAHELRRSEGAVKQLQLRALEKLREKLGGRV
jgi:RNA polymerase sigma-70 factor (ECF subfamily)